MIKMINFMSRIFHHDGSDLRKSQQCSGQPRRLFTPELSSLHSSPPWNCPDGVKLPEKDLFPRQLVPLTHHVSALTRNRSQSTFFGKNFPLKTLYQTFVKNTEFCYVIRTFWDQLLGSGLCELFWVNELISFRIFRRVCLSFQAHSIFSRPQCQIYSTVTSKPGSGTHESGVYTMSASFNHKAWLT